MAYYDLVFTCVTKTDTTDTTFYPLFIFVSSFCNVVDTKNYRYPVVGIVTWYRNGVTNKQLFFLFKTITSYKSNGSGLVENAIGRYKQKL
jgi:hypothetical protein